MDEVDIDVPKLRQALLAFESASKGLGALEERERWIKRLREMEVDLEKRSRNHPTEYWTAVAIIDMTRNYFPEVIKESSDAE